MAAILQRPPDLDASGQPIGAAAAPTPPPDLDEQGKPIFRSSTADPEPDWIDKIASWLPAIGGTVGGIAGAAAGGPVGAIGLAALGGAGGEAYKELINRARGRSTTPKTDLDAAKDIGEEGAIQGGAQAVGDAVVAPAARAIGARVMQSAVKPGLKLLTRAVDAGETPQVVQTLLREGVNVTPGGVAKLQNLLGANRAEINAAIAPVADTEIPALKVASRLTDVAKRFTNQVNPQPDLDAISKVGENFLEHPAISPQGTLTLEQAQALKQGTYAQLKGKYGPQSGVTPAAIEAEKALARGLKEDVAAEVPNLDTLNERHGQLLEALHAVGKRAALSGNKDPMGLAWVAHNPTTFLAALIDRSPAIKSLLARGLYNHAGAIAQVPPALVRVAVHSMLSDDPNAASATSTDPGGPR